MVFQGLVITGSLSNYTSYSCKEQFILMDNDRWQQFIWADPLTHKWMHRWWFSHFLSCLESLFSTIPRIFWKRFWKEILHRQTLKTLLLVLYTMQMSSTLWWDTLWALLASIANYVDWMERCQTTISSLEERDKDISQIGTPERDINRSTTFWVFIPWGRRH